VSPSRNLVLVHGFLGSALNWGPVLTSLRRAPEMAGWQFLAVDLLGHGGRRSSPLGPYDHLTLDRVAEDLWLQCAGKAPFVALGHSFGLRPLLRLSAHHPGAIERLIVEDSSPIVDQPNFQNLNRILTDTPVPFTTRTEAQDYFLKTYPGKMGAFLLSNIRQNPDSGLYDWRFDFQGLSELLRDSYEHPQWKEWEALSIPIDLIRGAHSDFLSRERCEEMIKRSKVPVRFQEVKAAGHWIHSDNVDDFVGALIKILNSSDGLK
jgi:esterase